MRTPGGIAEQEPLLDTNDGALEASDAVVLSNI